MTTTKYRPRYEYRVDDGVPLIFDSWHLAPIFVDWRGDDRGVVVIHELISLANEAHERRLAADHTERNDK